MPRKTPTRPRSARGKKAFSKRHDAVVAITRRLLDLHLAAVRATVAAALSKGLA